MHTLWGTCENFCRIALRSGICMSWSIYISHFYKYFQSCLPKRILLTNSAWDCLFPHTSFLFIFANLTKKKFFFPKLHFSDSRWGWANSLLWGVIYISSRNCILPICCLFFIKDVLCMFWMIIFCLKCVAYIFFLSCNFSKWQTHCSHHSSNLCFQLIRNSTFIMVLLYVWLCNCLLLSVPLAYFLLLLQN